MNKLIKQAFTLIELLVVIAIIGILSGLIVVAINGTTQKATIAKSQVFSNSLRDSLLLNLISEWKLDENTGNTTIDSWSGGNTGTLTGTTLPTWKTGSDCVNGSCVQFDGVDDFVDFGTNSNLSMGLGDTTISLWVRFDNAIAPQNETLIACGAASNTIGQDGYWIFRYNGSSRLYVRFMDGETAAFIQNYITPLNYFSANTWYNVVIVFDRDGLAQGYIDGVKQNDSLTISTQQGNVVNSVNYKIGAWSSVSHRLAGKMDEVRLYNLAMPTSQIKEQYYAGLNSLFFNGNIDKKEYGERINLIAKQ